ncbi:MAG: pentapeptide repeat-containing protein [Pseudomonadota bacterium]|nr:pentapeptide repeat-containing protein [Pseudomonadota bacterium]
MDPTAPEQTKPIKRDEAWLFEQAEKRLAAANEAIRSTRTFFFALLSVAAYIGVVIASTTDEQLLRISPVKLPIIGVEVPLTGFYLSVPWLFVVLHFNLLIHLGLTSRKLKGFLDDLKPLNQDLSQRLRRDVANFPLAQWMVRNHDQLLRPVLAIMAWITLVAIPPFLLLWMQLRFLAFQDETITWLQATAVGVDAILIIGFHAWFVQHIQPKTRWLAGWKELGEREDKALAISFRLTVTKPLFRYLVPLVPLGLTGYLTFGLSNLIDSDNVLECNPLLRPLGSAADDGMPHERWLCRQYRVDLTESFVTRNTPSPEVVNALRGDDAEARKKALGEILGFYLKDRNLRGADLYRAVLPRADLRGAQLQGARLEKAVLQAANLEEANFKGANLRGANLEGANLRDAKLRGVNPMMLSDAFTLLLQFFTQSQPDATNLSDATLWGARLEHANLRYANLTGASLWRAHLEGANLTRALLQDVDLEGAYLTGAVLMSVDLRGATLLGTHLEGANLWYAKLGGADFTGANLHSAKLHDTNLEWADLTEADLSFVDLRKAQNLDTAEFAGADYLFADLTGTFLDWNQPPPDVLPAP